MRSARGGDVTIERRRRDTETVRDLAAAAGSAEGFGLHGIALLVAFGKAGVAEQHALAGFHNRPFVHSDQKPRICTGICLRKSCFRIAAKGKRSKKRPSPIQEAHDEAFLIKRARRGPAGR
jgi:hypothetical protein